MSRQGGAGQEGQEGEGQKKTNFFFIKSKHAFQNYKNHDYFEDQLRKGRAGEYSRAGEFVQSPAPYGISNAYDYICQEVSKNNLKKYRSNDKKIKTVHERYEEPSRARHSPNPKRKTHFTLPNLTESKKEELLQEKGSLREKRREGSLTAIERRRQKQSWERVERRKELCVKLVYVQAGEGLREFELGLDIHSYVLSTFLKTKIDYEELTQEQFEFVVAKILEVYPKPREAMDYKDLVNLSSVKDIFSTLLSFEHKEVETRETLRYFFVAKEEVYEYQFQRIKDEIRERLKFQFQNKLPSEMEVFVFEPHSGLEIASLYELMGLRGERLLVGGSQEVLGAYLSQKEEASSRRNAAERVSKWKNIISDKTVSGGWFRPIPVQKYQHLFENAQMKRNKFNRTKKKSQVAIKHSQFVNKEHLHKDQNIFQ